MIEINNKRMCRHCFSPAIPGASKCMACGKSDAEPPLKGTLSPGAVLHGRYILGRVLGRGGFGITYMGYDSKTDRIVAIKEFFPNTLVIRAKDGVTAQVRDDQSRTLFEHSMRRFCDEAQFLSELKHPNIIDIYHLYPENGTIYYTMEFLDGCNLQRFVASHGSKLSEQELVPILACVSEALQTVHNKGLLHRDVAPDNIYITRRGDVKLIDFGASRNFVTNASKSFSLTLKQGFAPIEQYQRKGHQGPWTDIYALGATAYYCLNGRMPPYSTDRISNPQVKVECSPTLAFVIQKMMMVRPEDRYKNIAELKIDLLTVLRISSESQQSESSEQRTSETPAGIIQSDFINVSQRGSEESQTNSTSERNENDKEPSIFLRIVNKIRKQPYIILVGLISALLIIILILLLNM